MSVAEVLAPESAGRIRNGRFAPGHSGNPSGRPKGNRNKLGEAFVHALQEHFQEHGAEAIERVFQEEPGAYLRVIAQVIPKELILHTSALDEMEREEIVDFVRRLEEAKRLAESNPEIARLMIEALPVKK